MTNCEVLLVPESCCEVSFEDGPSTRRARTEQLPDTVRGEMVLAHLDEHGKIKRLELVSPGLKPCQR